MPKEKQAKYSKKSFFIFLLGKNLGYSYLIGILCFLIFILLISFKLVRVDNPRTQYLLLGVILISLFLITKNFWVSLIEFFKRDAYKSFLVSNFLYKSKIIRLILSNGVESLDKRLDFFEPFSKESINGQIAFNDLREIMINLKEKTSKFYNRDFLVEQEAYELVSKKFRNLYNLNYRLRGIYEIAFWNTVENFRREMFVSEEGLDYFEKILDKLLASTLEEQETLFSKLKEVGLLPRIMILPR